jgi:hypothetical protein
MENDRLTRRVAFYDRPETIRLLERLAADQGHSLSAAIRGSIRHTLAGEYRARLDDEQLQEGAMAAARASLRARGLPADGTDPEVAELLRAWADELER